MDEGTAHETALSLATLLVCGIAFFALMVWITTAPASEVCLSKKEARQLWPKSLVIGVDNKDVLETAMRLHAIDVAADDLIVLAEADVVLLAMKDAEIERQHRQHEHIEDDPEDPIRRHA